MEEKFVFANEQAHILAMLQYAIRLIDEGRMTVAESLVHRAEMEINRVLDKLDVLRVEDGND